MFRATRPSPFPRSDRGSPRQLHLSRITPLILATALFMENMDSTVIATSLAAIAADIGTDPISLKLALTAYLVALAIFIPISSWMADRFGARNVFRVAMAGVRARLDRLRVLELAAGVCRRAVPAGHGRGDDDAGGAAGAGAGDAAARPGQCHGVADHSGADRADRRAAVRRLPDHVFLAGTGSS